MKRGHRFAWAGYATIIRQLQTASYSAWALAEVNGCEVIMMRRILNRLHDMQIVCIVGWVRGRAQGPYAAEYTFGREPDAPPPGPRPGRKRGPLTRATMLPELTHVVAMLKTMAEPTAKTDLHEAVGGAYNNVCRFVNHCREIGLVHVGDWKRRDGGGFVAPMFQLGDGPDVVRPRHEKRKAIEARSKAKVRSFQSMQRVLAALSFQPVAEAA